MFRTWFLTVFSEMKSSGSDVPVVHALGHELQDLELALGEAGAGNLAALVAALNHRGELGEELMPSTER